MKKNLIKKFLKIFAWQFQRDKNILHGLLFLKENQFVFFFKEKCKIWRKISMKKHTSQLELIGKYSQKIWRKWVLMTSGGQPTHLD